MAPLSVTINEHDGIALIALRGDLTAASVLPVQQHLTQLLRSTPALVVVDLSGLTKCDATGALVLDVTARVAADHGGQIRLAAPSTAVHRALTRAGTLQRAPAFASIDAAVHPDHHPDATVR